MSCFYVLLFQRIRFDVVCKEDMFINYVRKAVMMSLRLAWNNKPFDFFNQRFFDLKKKLMAVLLRLSTLTCTSRAIPKFNYLNRAVKHFTKVLRSADVIRHNIHDIVNMDMKVYAKDDIIVLHCPLPPQQYCYKCL